MFKDMTTLLEDREEGFFKLDRFTVGDNDFGAMVSGVSKGTYMRLKHNGEVVMSNTYMEERTNMDFIYNAYGDILIGGLGIGMIIMAIQDNPEVKSITVIERYEEVINMVATQLKFNDKVKIINADVFDWKPEKGNKYDVIYMDIWNYINEVIYNEEMKPLKRKFSRYLKSKELSPKRFNKCWAEWQAKNGRRL